jgi:hypothetical protein
VTLFTGLQPSRPLDVLFLSGNLEASTVNREPLSKKHYQQFINDLNERLEKLHASSNELTSKERARDSRRNVSPMPNLNMGDFVLIASDVARYGDKLSVWWRGPFRVVGFVSEFVYKVQSLLDENDIKETHIARIKFYAEKDMNVSEKLLDQIAHQRGFYDIGLFKGIRWNKSLLHYEVLVSWKGFSDSEDSWEPCSVIHEDAPDFLKKYLLESSLPGAKQLLASLYPEGEV